MIVHHAIMLLLYGILLLPAGLDVVYAATFYEVLETKPDKYKDIAGCYVSELDMVVPVYQQVTSPDCMLYKCLEDIVNYYTCDFNMTAPDCKMLSMPKRNKQYPECCPVFECYEPKPTMGSRFYTVEHKS